MFAFAFVFDNVPEKQSVVFVATEDFADWSTTLEKKESRMPLEVMAAAAAAVLENRGGYCRCRPLVAAAALSFFRKMCFRRAELRLFYMSTRS